MRLLGCVDPGPHGRGQAVGGDIQAAPLERPLPCRSQRDQVRCRAATGEHPLVGRRDAAQLGHPVQRHPLKSVKCLHPVPLAASRRRQPSRHSRGGRPGRDETAPARLTDPRPVRDDHFGQIRDDGPDPAAILRQGHIQAGQPARPPPGRVITAVIPPELLDRRQYLLHRCCQLPQLSGIAAVQYSRGDLGIRVHHTLHACYPDKPPGIPRSTHRLASNPADSPVVASSRPAPRRWPDRHLTS